MYEQCIAQQQSHGIVPKLHKVSKKMFNVSALDC